MMLPLAIAVALLACALLFSYWVNQYNERQRCSHQWVGVGPGQHQCQKCGRLETAPGPR